MKHTTIPKARAKLAAALPSTTEILRGSLLHRRIRHRTGCAVCARWPGHLVWVSTVSYPGGRTKRISLSAERKSLVQNLTGATAGRVHVATPGRTLSSDMPSGCHSASGCSKRQRFFDKRLWRMMVGGQHFPKAHSRYTGKNHDHR